MAYVYRHIRKDTNMPFYIGIGTREDNYRRAYVKCKRNSIWNKIVKKTEYEVEILLDGLSDEECLKKEQEFIALYGRMDTKTGTLCNLNDGGNLNKGWIPSKEWRKKLAERRRGYVPTKETRLKMRESQLKRTDDRTMSDETKNKIRNAMKGRKPAKHTIEALKDKLTGVPFSQERRNKMGKEVINIETGEIYPTYRVAAEANGIKYKTLMSYLNGRIYNKTPLRKLENDRSLLKEKVRNQSRGNSGTAKKVIDTKTKQVFDCAKDAADFYGLSINSLYRWLRNENKNPTSLRYLKK